MSSPVFTGVGAVAFKYYMLYQHHSIPDETDKEEPSWLLGSSPGPYINELSRSLFMFMGRQVAFLGLDCRTERMKDEILSQDTYDRIFERLRREIVKGETMHLIVLLGVPIAYPRLNFLENVLTSRAMDPIKALGRLGMFGGFLNKFDGGVEILDDLDDHWTAKHHKHERNWFIQELQELAAEKSVRVTILGGDVHLAAVGQFYSNKKLRIPKDQDHRYMPNIISSAIVNTPPPEMMGDILNKRNKTHHLDHDTDEDMIPLFTHDVDGKRRNNHNLLPRRNWLMIREYAPGSTPPPTPPLTPSEAPPSRRGSFGSFKLGRTLSLGRDGVTRRLSKKNPGGKPPRSFFNRGDAATAAAEPRRASDPVISRPTDGSSGYFTGIPPAGPTDPVPRPNPFHRVPTGLSEKAALRGAQMDQNVEAHINLQHGLDIVLNLEVSQHDPAGITTPYRLLVPALRYEGEGDINSVSGVRRVGLGRWLSTKIRGRRGGYKDRDVGYDSEFDSEGEMTPGPRPLSGVQQPVATLPQAAAGASQPYSYGHDGVVDATGAAHANANATAPLPQHNAMHNAIHNAVHNTSHSASHNAAHNISHNTSHNGALAQIGPDGRPVRTRFRGDLYQEAEPARVADEADEYSDLDTPGPRPQAAVGNGRGIGYGYGGVEQPVVKKKPNWKIWR